MLHKLIEHLGCQLVQDASYLAEQLLNDRTTFEFKHKSKRHRVALSNELGILQVNREDVL